MSHFKLLVTQTDKLSLAKQLAPFEEVDSHDQANRKWSWYEVGGRWCGYFKLRPGAVGADTHRNIWSRDARRGGMRIGRVTAWVHRP